MTSADAEEAGPRDGAGLLGASGLGASGLGASGLGASGLGASGLAPTEHADRAFARVALLSPLPQLDRPFEYAVPERLRVGVRPGVRVRAPLRTGGRLVEGFVLATSAEPEYQGKLAELEAVLSEAPVLTPEIASLARRVADRQGGTAADVLRLAVPARSARLEARWCEEAGERAERLAAVPAQPTPRLPVLEDAYGEAGFARLTAAGARIALTAPAGVDEHGVPRAHAALAELAAARVAAGEDVILAVPDFRDVELAGEALSRLLPADRIRRFDSRLKPAQRAASFLADLEGPPGVALGTRSAVYAPAPRLGAILMLDDADESYAEPLAPYAHARDVALLRQDARGCALVLASRAPSVESRRLVGLGFLEELAPTRRTGPRILLSDGAIDGDDRLRAARIPSMAWQAANRALDDGPVLVQVSRAGYVPALACGSCRTPAVCRSCRAPLSLAALASEPSCRICGAVHGGWRCPECGGAELRPLAVGAGRTAEELGRAFPGARVLVADGESELVQVERARTLVIATRGAEPAVPGGYGAVLLLDAERMLAREGLDVALDALRGWTNAAALAADDGVVVLVGGASPAAVALRDGRQVAYADEELAVRRQLRFPPAVRVAQVTGTSAEVDAALGALRAAGELDVLGPVPAAEGGVVATIRFGYADGAAVARAAKAAVVLAATSRARGAGAVSGRPGPRRSTLRIRLDPPDAF
ncbi:putative primosomal protein N' [Pseudoclavibacter triregionum]|nr:putative primosomal protein N' [Pseudoclavibacter triregionum]